MAQPLVNFSCQFPSTTPLSPESLLLTWNPSSLRGAILVRPGPRLLVNWPPHPHSLLPPPQWFPQFNCAPFSDDITTPTSLNRNTRHWQGLFKMLNKRCSLINGQKLCLALDCQCHPYLKNCEESDLTPIFMKFSPKIALHTQCTENARKPECRWKV